MEGVDLFLVRSRADLAGVDHDRRERVWGGVCGVVRGGVRAVVGGECGLLGVGWELLL